MAKIREFVESQIAVLSSATLLQKVVDGEKLTEDARIGAEALEWLEGAVEVSRVGVSDVIELSVTSYDPEKSTSLANAIAEAYVVDRVKSRYESAKRAATWLSERAEILRVELSHSEDAVEKFRAEHNLLSTQAGSLTEQQLSELNIDVDQCGGGTGNQTREISAGGETDSHGWRHSGDT